MIKVTIIKHHTLVDSYTINRGEEQTELKEIKLNPIYKDCQIYMNGKLRLIL